MIKRKGVKRRNMTAMEVELAVAKFLDWRRNLIVPNVSWGLGVHECDLLSVTPARWATEVEIKVSKSDIKKDLEKTHQHKSDLIQKLYFAVPDYLSDCEYIPDGVGIISVKNNASLYFYNKAAIIRTPTVNKAARKLSEAEYDKLLRLGCLRIWNLKKALHKNKMNLKR